MITYFAETVSFFLRTADGVNYCHVWDFCIYVHDGD